MTLDISGDVSSKDAAAGAAQMAVLCADALLAELAKQEGVG